MSCIYKGRVLETELSQNSKGGTEQMRSRLLNSIKPKILENFAIHLSRPREIFNDVFNVLWLHDLPLDNANFMLSDDRKHDFVAYVFVSNWQMNEYLKIFDLDRNKCFVIQNAIETSYVSEKPIDCLNFIYHTTPHRGLNIAYAVFNAVSNSISVKTKFNVFSSFEIYGWKQRDAEYNSLFDALKSDDRVNYHGFAENSVVLDALSKSHIFLYPSIWQETSCIAMIESIDRGCVPIYHDYGALRETAGTNGKFYRYEPNLHENASLCFQSTMEVIKNYDKYKQMETNDNNKIERFREKWEKLLTNLMSNL